MNSHSSPLTLPGEERDAADDSPFYLFNPTLISDLNKHLKAFVQIVKKHVNIQYTKVKKYLKTKAKKSAKLAMKKRTSTRAATIKNIKNLHLKDWVEKMYNKYVFELKNNIIYRCTPADTPEMCAEKEAIMKRLLNEKLTELHKIVTAEQYFMYELKELHNKVVDIILYKLEVELTANNLVAIANYEGINESVESIFELYYMVHNKSREYKAHPENTYSHALFLLELICKPDVDISFKRRVNVQLLESEITKCVSPTKEYLAPYGISPTDSDVPSLTEEERPTKRYAQRIVHSRKAKRKRPEMSDTDSLESEISREAKTVMRRFPSGTVDIAALRAAIEAKLLGGPDFYMEHNGSDDKFMPVPYTSEYLPKHVVEKHRPYKKFVFTRKRKASTTPI